MGIRIEKKLVVYESVTLNAIEPQYVFPDREEVKEYLKENPFPEIDGYDKDHLLWDTQSDGFWTLPENVTGEQKEYIINMIDHFM